MSKRVFIWVAHPKAGSLCAAMADAYQAGLEQNGAEVRRLNLCDMRFDMDFDGYGETAPALEPDLLAWQDAIRWSEHMLFVHPYWWGAMPTKAKAVLDRALTPGFAYKYHQRGMGWSKLLSGRSADVFVTSDTPPLIDALVYRRPGRRVIKNQVLGFCGVHARNVLQFGSVKLASPEKIDRWLKRARRLGAAAAAA